MITLNNSIFLVEILDDCGFTISQIYYKENSILYFPFSEKEYKGNKELAGIPFLYPFANRIARKEFYLEGKLIQISKDYSFFDPNDLPIHGFLLKSSYWNIKEKKDNYIIAKLDFKNNHLFELFPFKHSIEYKIELKENQIHFYITIIPEENIPVSFGFHPYFLLHHHKSDIKLILPAKKFIKTDEKLLPTGQLLSMEDFFEQYHILSKKVSEGYIFSVNHFFDYGFTDFFINNNYNKIQFIQKNYNLNINMDKNYKVCQIYSPLESNFICIEPMLTETNAFLTNNYILVKEKQIFHFYIEINVSDEIQLNHNR
ncbi:MAG: aldose 1-epimerase [Leptospiraceae bacterium]|nr:MAG: aldose 1-epimerase [Leptospiraceae bacterium]